MGGLPGRTLESEWLAKDNLETNSIIINPETDSQEAEQFSWVPLPYCSAPGRPFPVKVLLCQHVCIHFQVLDKSPLLGPGRGSPSCNKSTSWGRNEIQAVGSELPLGNYRMCFKPDTALHLAVMPDLLVTMSGLPCWFFLKLKKKKTNKNRM